MRFHNTKSQVTNR